MRHSWFAVEWERQQTSFTTPLGLVPPVLYYCSMFCILCPAFAQLPPRGPVSTPGSSLCWHSHPARSPLGAQGASCQARVQEHSHGAAHSSSQATVLLAHRAACQLSLSGHLGHALLEPRCDPSSNSPTNASELHVPPPASPAGAIPCREKAGRGTGERPQGQSLEGNWLRLMLDNSGYVQKPVVYLGIRCPLPKPLTLLLPAPGLPSCFPPCPA